MKRHIVRPAAILIIVCLICQPAAGRGGGGRGGGGFHGGGGFGGGGGFHGGGGFGGGGFGGGGGYRGGGNFGGGGREFGGGGREFGGGGREFGGGEFGGRGFDGGRGPQIGDRGALNNRPGENRPVNNPFVRPGGAGNRPGNLPANRPGDRGNFADRNGNRFNHIDHDHWHHGYWHGNWNNWNHGWYNHPWAWWGAGAATGLVASAIPWSWGYWGYSNPYVVAGDDSSFDYSQPILASDAPVDDPNAQGPSQSDLATQEFDEAREAFTNGDYQQALDKVNQAIAKVPNDTTLHEFRGLCFFAMGKYQDAAAAVYAVLAAGPGWDWTTLISLYPNAEIYTKQLRALEAYRNDHMDAADAHFLLAYEYLTCGQPEAAAKELKAVVKINPNDPLSKQLLAGLTPPADGAPADAVAKPAAPAVPATPVTAASLTGKWTAKRPDGGSIALDLSQDAKFNWKYAQQQGKPHDFDGTYTVADNLLVLNQNNNPAMVGQVSQVSGNSFNFRLAGSPTGDPGLTFTK